MKKHISIFLVLALSFFLFSCQKGATGPAGATGTTPSDSVHTAVYQQGVATYAGCYDARIWNELPDANYGSVSSSMVGTYSTDQAKRFIIEFYINDIPPDAQIQKTVISLKSDNTMFESPSFTFYEMDTPWMENETTWNESQTAVSWTTPGGDYDDTTPVSNSVSVGEAYTWYSWTVDKSLIESKISDPSSTYGFILVRDNEISYGDNQAEFIYSEYGTAEDRPKLTIYYTLP